MIDSHCHLNFESLEKNFKTIINNAKLNDITSILTINTDPKDFEKHYELIKNYQSIYISYGLHPEHVSNINFIDKDLIINNTKLDKVIGIGETGLDFYHSDLYKKEQYKVFEEHIEASIASDLPLIVHQRNSEEEIIHVLKRYLNSHNLKLVVHCFTGSAKLKKFCIDNNFYISLSGIITFKNANNLRDIIKDIPLELLLIETDSPFLSPAPFRGKINEPSYVKHIAEFLSTFLNISLQNLNEITDNNFYNLFSKAIRYNEISQ